MALKQVYRLLLCLYLALFVRSIVQNTGLQAQERFYQNPYSKNRGVLQGCFLVVVYLKEKKVGDTWYKHLFFLQLWGKHRCLPLSHCGASHQHWLCPLWNSNNPFLALFIGRTGRKLCTLAVLKSFTHSMCIPCNTETVPCFQIASQVVYRDKPTKDIFTLISQDWFIISTAFEQDTLAA